MDGAAVAPVIRPQHAEIWHERPWFGTEYVLHGFRNADIRRNFFGETPVDKQHLRRQSAAVTRKFRLLRAHGLIRKLAHTNRYAVTDKGRSQIGLLLLARQKDAQQLCSAA
jgi:hypothetical protein